MSTENEKLVTDFCVSWSRKNVEDILSYLTDDCFLSQQSLWNHAWVKEPSVSLSTFSERRAIRRVRD